MFLVNVFFDLLSLLFSKSHCPRPTSLAMTHIFKGNHKKHIQMHITTVPIFSASPFAVIEKLLAFLPDTPPSLYLGFFSCKYPQDASFHLRFKVFFHHLFVPISKQRSFFKNSPCSYYFPVSLYRKMLKSLTFVFVGNPPFANYI